MRFRMGFLPLFLLSCAFANPGADAQLAGNMANSKHLIEFGWDEPDTAFLRRHLAQVESTPFDGCVFHVASRSKTGQVEDLRWLAWGTRAFSREEVAHAIEDLRTLKPLRPRHDFLRFNTTPGTLDWFDDHAAVLQNARLIAEIAKQGNCRGILLDTEQYEGKLFRYASQRDARTKPFATYAAQVRRRGAEVMRAFQQGYPGVTILLTFGHSYPWDLMHRQPPMALEQTDYGLLAAFVDGLVDGAEGSTRIVDGHERSYGYKTRAQFEMAREAMTSGVMPIVADPEKYRRVVRPGFGLWLDYDREKYPWNVDDPSRNYFSPEAFRGSLKLALEHADEIVWVYSETPRWWTERGVAEKLPKVYDEAIRREIRP